jgi:hypothetical protein
MPDCDIIERGLHKTWRPPYRLMKGGHSPEVVANGLVTALAADLRDTGGLPGGLERLLAVQAQLGAVRSLAEVSRALEQEFGQRQRAKLLARAAQRASAKVAAKQALPGPVPIVLDYLWARLRHGFFARVSFRLVQTSDCFNDAQGVREFEARVSALLVPQLAKLAQRLLGYPAATRLRAPSSARRRPTTAELLDRPLNGGD